MSTGVLNSPRCPHCCMHGVPFDEWCGWCEDLNEGYYDCYIPPDEDMWLCPHGVGKGLDE